MQNTKKESKCYFVDLKYAPARNMTLHLFLEERISREFLENTTQKLLRTK